MMPLRREKNSSHTHKTGSWYLLGVLSKLSHEHPRLFHMGFPPGGKGGFHRATVPQIPRWREPWDRDRKKLHKILTCGELRFWDDNDVLFWEIVFLLTPVHQACRERLSTRLANVSLPSRGSIWPNLTWALTKPGTIPENTVNVASRYVISRKRLFNPGVTVICVSPWYVYSRTHITSDMCIPRGDTQNTDTRLGIQWTKWRLAVKSGRNQKLIRAQWSSLGFLQFGWDPTDSIVYLTKTSNSG